MPTSDDEQPGGGGFVPEIERFYQRHVRAVIETAFGYVLHGHAGGAQQLADIGGEPGRSWGLEPADRGG